MKYTDEINELRLLPRNQKVANLIGLLRGKVTELRGKGNPDLQLSASALVFTEGGLIFIEHPYQKIPLLPAGHVEIGETPLAAACREFHEETGGTAAEGRLVDANMIEIPENPEKGEKAHRHIDFRYLLKLTSPMTETAELPHFVLTREQAAEEFKAYYDLR